MRLGKLRILLATLATIVVVGLIITGCGSSRHAPKPTARPTRGASAEVTSLLTGIPQHGSTLGHPNAPLTLQYFADLQCPFCRQFTLTVLPSIIKKWVRGGKLRIVYRSEETATHDPEVFKVQQVAALAAGSQQKLWNFIELFYYDQGRENTGYVTEGFLQGLAQQVAGLDLIAWTAARNDGAAVDRLNRDARAAHNAGVTGTPAFFLGRTGGPLKRFRPGTSTEAAPYDAAIERLLRG
jgi:protein-disulfide isomerase